MNVPLIPLDIISTSNPFEKTIKLNRNYADFIGRLGIRMASLFGMSDDNVIKNAKANEFGIADAINFYFKYQTPSKEFLDRLYGGEAITPTLILDCLTNKNSAIKEKNIKWPWDSNESNLSTAMYSYSSGNYYYIYSSAKNAYYRHTATGGATPTINGLSFFIAKILSSKPLTNIATA